MSYYVGNELFNACTGYAAFNFPTFPHRYRYDLRATTVAPQVFLQAITQYTTVSAVCRYTSRVSSSGRLTMRSCLRVLFSLALPWVGLAPAWAQTPVYNVVKDFSINSNPNEHWYYDAVGIRA